MLYKDYIDQSYTLVEKYMDEHPEVKEWAEENFKPLLNLKDTSIEKPQDLSEEDAKTLKRILFKMSLSETIQGQSITSQLTSDEYFKNAEEIMDDPNFREAFFAPSVLYPETGEKSLDVLLMHDDPLVVIECAYNLAFQEIISKFFE